MDANPAHGLPQAVDVSASQGQSKTRIEFKYLDGLRALSALAVVALHAYLFTGHTGDAARELPIIGNVVGWGYLGVPVFIVISGYVLMLPATNDPRRALRGGPIGFIKRRARRILPPYYAALLIAVLMVVLIPVLRRPAGTQWDSKIPVNASNVIAHIFLVQDLKPGWIEKIDGPLWSVAVEWQIYFAMAFVLLPLWRRMNPALLVGIALLLSAIPMVTGFCDFLHPWFLGLFAAGMLAAQLTVGKKPVYRIGSVSIGLIACVPVVLVVRHITGFLSLGLPELAVGLAVAATLVWAGRQTLAGSVPKVMKPLQSRPMLFLGLFSYSIYLLHSPLLGLANILLLPLGLEVHLQWALLTFVAAPIAITACWLFYLQVERHFQNSRQTRAAHEVAQGV